MKKITKMLFIVLCLSFTLGVFAACFDGVNETKKTKLDSPEINSAVYTGEKLTAVVPVSENYEVLTNNGGINVGTYDVVLKLKDTEKFEWATPDEDDSANLTLKFEITKATNEITSLVLSDWTYGSEANAPSATAKFGTPSFAYSAEENGTYTENVPTTPGTYFVKATVAGTENYEAAEKTISFKIDKTKATVAVAPVAVENLVYTGEAQTLIVAGSTSEGAMAYKLEGGEWGETLPSAINAGEYTVYYKVVGDDNHSDSDEASVAVTIARAASVVKTAPEAVENLVYTGEALSLVVAGESDHGTIAYKIGDGEWSENLPSAINAGEYTVYYKVKGDENHNDSAETSLTVSIAKAENAITFSLENAELHCRESLSDDYGATATDGTVVYTYSADGETFCALADFGAVIEAGKTYYVKASVAETANYKSAEKIQSIAASHKFGEATEEDGVTFEACKCGERKLLVVKKTLDPVTLDLEATVSDDGSVAAANGKAIAFDFSEYYGENTTAALYSGETSLGDVEVVEGKFSHSITIGTYGNVGYKVVFEIQHEDYKTEYEMTLNALVITKTITTVDELRAMKDYVDSETMQGGGYYRLGADIEAGEWFNSYGAAESARHDYRFGVEYAFSGVLDGNGYAIKKLVLAIPKEHSGFIHEINGGIVKNIAFTDLALGSDESLVYKGSGTFENVYVKYSAATGFASNGQGTGSNGGWASSICGPFFTYYEDNSPNYAVMNNVVIDMSEISDSAWASCKSQSVIGTLGNDSLLTNVAVIGMKKEFRVGNIGKLFRNSNGYCDWTGMGGGKVPQYVYLTYSDGTVEESERFASFPSDGWNSEFWTIDGENKTIAWNAKA